MVTSLNLLLDSTRINKTKGSYYGVILIYYYIKFIAIFQVLFLFYEFFLHCSIQFIVELFLSYEFT